MHCGDILNNKYVIINKLGSGHFSEVWLGIVIHNTNIPKYEYVAIKIFNDNYIKCGLNEIEILKKIATKKCKYIVSYIDYFKTNHMFCIVQELMVGSLYTIMKSQFKNGFPEKILTQITIELLKALVVVHDQLKMVHADIKPENILLVGHSIEVDNIIEKINNTIVIGKKKINIKQFSSKIKSLFNTPKNIDLPESESGSTSHYSSYSSSIEYTDSDITSEHTMECDRDCLESDTSSYHAYDENKVVDEKYINNPHIVLADFGNCLSINELTHMGDVQTRHYRAPEIILRLELDEKIDIWAIGCTIFELLNGKVLFNPNKSIGITSDLQHLSDFQCLLGQFPQKFYESRKKNIFFKNNSLLKKNIEYACDLKQMLTVDGEFNKINKIIINALNYDSNLRSSASEMLKYIH